MIQDKPLILFVDDEANAGKYFAKVFARNFTVITRESVDDAEAVLDERGDDIAILVTDQRMPKRSGTDLLKYCVDTHPHIIRILTTAYAELDAAITAVNSGEIFRYIVKPWDIALFDQAMNEAASLYRQQARERELLQEKRRTALSIGGHIAHELRTPLSSIEMGITSINRYLPDLLHGYAAANQHNLIRKPIPSARLNGLKEVLNRTINSVRTAHSTIDTLLANIRDPDDAKAHFEIFSMRETIELALERFPFQSNTYEWVHLEGDDFTYFGSQNLMNQVLHNLLKNSLDALNTSPPNTPHIEINIQAGSKGNAHQVHFIDNGPGINEHDLPIIFNDFFTTKEITSGNGLGLGFSQRVIHAFNGELSCNSICDQHTQFNIVLPNLNTHLSV